MGHWIKVLIALVYRPIEDEYQIQIICSFNFISLEEIVFDYCSSSPVDSPTASRLGCLCHRRIGSSGLKPKWSELRMTLALENKYIIKVKIHTVQ